MKKLSIFVLTLVLSAVAFGQGSYKQPPNEIQEILDAPVIP